MNAELKTIPEKKAWETPTLKFISIDATEDGAVARSVEDDYWGYNDDAIS
jgi:hypothetical protein